MNKKAILIIVIIIFAAVVLIRFWGPEDTWICSQGKWVKHGMPAAEKPDKGCGQLKDEMIRVLSPESDQLKNRVRVMPRVLIRA